MLNDILTASGIPYRQGRFLNPPAETYGIYFDNLTVDGPDPLPGVPQTVRHDVMVELYEPQPDPDAEAALEAEFRARGLHWTKEDRYWLQNVQRYQVVYEFNYNEKVRA
jgi:hypothetical protein